MKKPQQINRRYKEAANGNFDTEKYKTKIRTSSGWPQQEDRGEKRKNL